MKAPISFRPFLIVLLVLSILGPYGCNNRTSIRPDYIGTPPTLIVQDDCCPGNSGSPCKGLVEELRNLEAIGTMQYQIAQDENGCPYVQNSFIVISTGWCKGPLNNPSIKPDYLIDKWKSQSKWDDLMNDVKSNLCFQVEDSLGMVNELEIVDPSALQALCPCDGNLMLFDTTKLKPEEGGAVASVKGGLQGNGILKLPGGLIDTDFDHINWSKDEFSSIALDHGGSSRKIAIIDSGIDKSWWDRVPNHFSNSYNLLDPGFEPIDEYGHGTVVASIIEKASTNEIINNSSRNKLLIYKAFDDEGVGTMFNVICALRCAQLNNADIINMSWGTYSESQGLEETVSSFNGGNNILVASKGNDCLMTPNSEANLNHYPSDYPGVVGVMALDERMGIASDAGWSYFDQANEIFIPPNVSIWRCSNWDAMDMKISAPGRLDYLNNDHIAPRYGTSFAAAYISGFTAKYFYDNGVYPNYGPGLQPTPLSEIRNITPHDGLMKKTWVPR